MTTRFGFSIRTRSGQRVENISIMAATRDDAERRLRQMYQRCEIVGCQQSAVPQRADPRPAQDFVAGTGHRTPLLGVAVGAVRSDALAAANDAPSPARSRRIDGAH